MKRATPALCLVLLVSALPALAAAEDVKISGTVVSGGPLLLPLAPSAAPVAIVVSLGLGALQIAVVVPPAPIPDSKEAPPIMLTQGDRVEIEAAVTAGGLQATKLEVADFPELEFFGPAQGLPPSGIILPLAPGTTVDFAVLFAGLALPVRLTASTLVKGAATSLANGQIVDIEARIAGDRLLVTTIER